LIFSEKGFLFLQKCIFAVLAPIFVFINDQFFM